MFVTYLFHTKASVSVQWWSTPITMLNVVVSAVFLLSYYYGMCQTTRTVPWCWCHPIHTTEMVQHKSRYTTTFNSAISMDDLYTESANSIWTMHLSERWRIHTKKWKNKKYNQRDISFVLLFSHLCFIFYSINTDIHLTMAAAAKTFCEFMTKWFLCISCI